MYFLSLLFSQLSIRRVNTSIYDLITIYVRFFCIMVLKHTLENIFSLKIAKTSIELSITIVLNFNVCSQF